MRIDEPIEKVAYSPAEAASALGLGVTVLRELLSRGEIKFCRCGRRVLIPKRQLQEFCDRLFAEQHGGGAGR